MEKQEASGKRVMDFGSVNQLEQCVTSPGPSVKQNSPIFSS